MTSLSPGKQRVLVLCAEDAPVPGVHEPTPNQRYRNPALSLQERDLSSIKDDQARVRVLYAGVCGTDVHLVETDSEAGYVVTSAPASIPEQGRVIGHEGVAQVIGVGNNVSHIRAGDYVAIASVFHCMYCEACRRGAFNQCHNAALLGMGLDGLFGDVVDIPASLAHDVSNHVDSEADLKAIACMEPAGTALLACETANIVAGDKVVVFGGGPIGLLTAIIARRAMGASEVSMVEPLPFRRNYAKQCCDEVYDVDEYLEHDKATVDVVIEASGQLDNVTRVFRRINPSGRVVLLARSGKSLTLDSIDHMITQAISVSACRGHLGGYLNNVLKLYKSGTLPLEAIVTETVESLDGLKKVLSEPDAISKNHCKILAKL